MTPTTPTSSTSPASSAPPRRRRTSTSTAARCGRWARCTASWRSSSTSHCWACRSTSRPACFRKVKARTCARRDNRSRKEAPSMKRTLTLLAALAIAPLAALAGTAEVRYLDPGRFTDLATSRTDEESNMKALGAHLQVLAQALPAGQVLRIDVLDVDLAGYVRHGPRGDRRIASD